MSLFQVSDTGKISVHGHLDHNTLSKDFWVCLSGAERDILKRTKTCTIDLSDVERVDSAGLAWLLNAIRDGKQQGIDVSLHDMPEKLLKLAKISDLDSFLPVN